MGSHASCMLPLHSLPPLPLSQHTRDSPTYPPTHSRPPKVFGMGLALRDLAGALADDSRMGEGAMGGGGGG